MKYDRTDILQSPLMKAAHNPPTDLFPKNNCIKRRNVIKYEIKL